MSGNASHVLTHVSVTMIFQVVDDLAYWCVRLVEEQGRRLVVQPQHAVGIEIIIEYLCGRGNMKSSVMGLFGSLIERILEDETINSVCFQPVNQKVLEIAHMFAGDNIREADHSVHAVYDI